MNEAVVRIQQQFIQEAINSPLLLSDLASMETYIAESYRDRSFIELLQNADDAKSKRFLIKRVDNYFIVANDGRPFTEADLVSICRSGASTKKRGGSSIGYRGIGFKSVVNLAERVHIISGDLKVTFCKNLSSKLLNTADYVPLIRIPHVLLSLVEEQLKTEIEELIDDNYNTLFIFENVKQSNLDIEFEEFDSSSLLFLRHVRQVEFLSDFTKIITLKRKLMNGIEYISIRDNGQEDWLVYRDREGKAGIALLIEDSEARILEDSRSVIHSFMPTKDVVGLPIKIHGDFSTDPSRTKIAQDENSEIAFDNCAALLVDLIELQLKGQIEVEGLFQILNLLDIDTASVITRNKPRKIFIESFKKEIQARKWLTIDSVNISNVEVRLKPDWLNQEDYVQTCVNLKYAPLPTEYEIKNPGLAGFLEKIDVQVLSITEVLQSTLLSQPTLTGGTEILAKCIQTFRYNMTDEAKELIKKAEFIMFGEKKYIALSKLTGDEKLDSEYHTRLKLILADLKDLNWFFKQLSVSLSNPGQETAIHSSQGNTSPETLPAEDHQQALTHVRTGFSSVRKWRSTEINLMHMLQQELDVQSVIDVSKSNLGYDLEVHKKSGIEFYEVKSVDEIGATFSMTNNEYATANEKADKYVLAIVKQTGEGLEVCFLKDPINSLHLTKRVTRWEWICDEYSGTQFNFKFTD